MKRYVDSLLLTLGVHVITYFHISGGILLYMDIAHNAAIRKLSRTNDMVPGLPPL